MLTIHREDDASIRSASAGDLPPEVVWIDLLSPSEQEKALIESRARVRIPSLEALSEIEASSRLAVDQDTIYLSLPAVAQGHAPDAYLSPVGFVLTQRVLVTVRFSPFPTFDIVAERVSKNETGESPVAVFMALLETMVDGGADALERLGAELDKVSRRVRNTLRDRMPPCAGR